MDTRWRRWKDRKGDNYSSDNGQFWQVPEWQRSNVSWKSKKDGARPLAINPWRQKMGTKHSFSIQNCQSKTTTRGISRQDSMLSCLFMFGQVHLIRPQVEIVDLLREKIRQKNLQGWMLHCYQKFLRAQKKRATKEYKNFKPLVQVFHF